MNERAIYAALPGKLLPWYRENARTLPWRADREPYHVWLSETMLQQTRAEVVCGYYTRFLSALPDIRALAEAEEELLYKLWEGLGYYSRVRNLQKAAKYIQSEYGGSFPERFEEIRALPGVGPYTAGAIASICFGQPRAAVDGNVLRVVSRLTENAAPIDLSGTRTGIAEKLECIYPADAAGDFTQALMELGATVCTPRAPQCISCPVRDICLARSHDRALSFPVRRPKRPRRLEGKTVFLLECEGRLALCRRTEPGVLNGMWQLPNLPGHLTDEEALKKADEWGLQPVELVMRRERSHVFTHICWQMCCYTIRCRCPVDAFVWCTAEELQESYALPSAFRMFLPEN